MQPQRKTVQNRFSIPGYIRTIGVCASAVILSGCAVASLAIPAATNLNGARESTIQTTIDDKTFTSDVRNAFLNAKYMGIVAADPTAIKVADVFEKRGGYIVKLDRVTAGEMTGSERRNHLQKLCSSRQTDLALLGRITKTDSSKSGFIGTLAGRVTFKENWTIEMLSCRAKTFQSFDGALEYDVGINSQKSQAEYAEMIGAGIGGKILASIGK
ncbi:MAG: hypothetical protein NTY60_01800 [Proteobacteria bacterium]|nr:hypothetical protein [Pseudomonadota bacterium]